MDAREAARQALSELMANEEKPKRVSEVLWRTRYLRSYIEETIIRAFALAGYGWRDIAEADKDEDKTYLLDDGKECAEGYWYISEWRWMNGGSCNPVRFHEIPVRSRG